MNIGKFLLPKVGIKDFFRQYTLMNRILLILIVGLMSSTSIFSQFRKSPAAEYKNAETKWVDSIYNQMSFYERVGQLFMVAAYSNKDSAHVKSIDKLITDYHIGGLIFFQGGPVRQAKLTNRYQSKSNVPLFIGIDAEWGLSMRLDSTYKYPWNMTLGAIQDVKLLEKLGSQMGKENRRMGIHFNFAPVLDINTNFKNPIIGNRSFGEDKKRVTEHALAYMKGLQNEGIFATGKHFPGHGDTETDSHHTLPFVKFDEHRVHDVELYPYKKLIKEGLASIMVAHLEVPGLECEPGLPTSLSYHVVTEILKEQMHFEGLIFTDALNMKGASNSRLPGEINVDAFMAGNDVLLFAEDIPLAIEKFCEAYDRAYLSDDRLAHSVKKILAHKFKVGLNHYHPIDLKNLHQDLNTFETDLLNYELYENSITVLKNEDHILPIKEIEKEKIAYIKIGEDTNDSFVNTLQNYTQVDVIQETNLDTLKLKLKDYTKVIIGYHKSDSHAWRNHDLKDSEIKLINEVANQNEVILDFFVKPYALASIKNFNKIKAIIISYQNNSIAQNISSQIIFGAVGAKGKLPVSINKNFAVGDGLTTKKLSRLGFNIPERVGMSSKVLARIDAKANEVIEKGITPGMQILVARKGQVIYNKSFGHHTFEKTTPVKNSDIYDVASLTKILSTLPNVMQKVEKGDFSLDTPLGSLLPDIFAQSNKRPITIKEMLSHHAGLSGWIPFYKSTLDSLNKPSNKYYRKVFSHEFPLQVADSLFLMATYKDTMMQTIAKSELLPKKKYKYSDLPFIIFNYYFEKQNTRLDVLSKNQFYKPLGASRTLYNPLTQFDKKVIPPTEEDNYFRYQRVQGYVHDMGAAMEGGVGGHAGLFSNSLDVAKIMQMYLQKGEYGGHRFFSEKTFDLFNTCHYCKEDNRRGLGFDKPVKGKSGPTCDCVSLTSFGHSGFTGTFAWVDPETEIVYVFLSNRTYPSAENNRLAKENVRSDFQEIITDAIIKE